VLVQDNCETGAFCPPQPSFGTQCAMQILACQTMEYVRKSKYPRQENRREEAIEMGKDDSTASGKYQRFQGGLTREMVLKFRVWYGSIPN
jgi:hypothetical protein